MAIKGVFGVLSRAAGFLASGGLLSDILAVTCVLMVLGGIYVKGRYDAGIACAEKNSAGIEKNVRQYGHVKKEGNSMDESELDSYLSKWMRD